MQHVLVESDVFDICGQLKAIDPNLKVIWFDREKDPYVISETSLDGVERLVFKAQELDGRVVEKIRYIMSVPLEERMALVVKANEAFEAAKAEADLDELYESMGRPMWTQLEHDGFIQRGVSYPKSGVAGGKGSAKRDK